MTSEGTEACWDIFSWPFWVPVRFKKEVSPQTPSPPPSTRCPHPPLHSRGLLSILDVIHCQRGSLNKVSEHRWPSLVLDDWWTLCWQRLPVVLSGPQQEACNWLTRGSSGTGNILCWLWQEVMVSNLYAAFLSNGSSQSIPIYFSQTHGHFLFLIFNLFCLYYPCNCRNCLPFTSIVWIQDSNIPLFFLVFSVSVYPEKRVAHSWLGWGKKEGKGPRKIFLF